MQCDECTSQHISSPLMEFERKKLINEYKTNPPAKTSDQDGTAPPPPEKLAEGEEPPVFIDYMWVKPYSMYCTVCPH